jgi:hypothetical protein
MTNKKLKKILKIIMSIKTQYRFISHGTHLVDNEHSAKSKTEVEIENRLILSTLAFERGEKV